MFILIYTRVKGPPRKQNNLSDEVFDQSSPNNSMAAAVAFEQLYGHGEGGTDRYFTSERTQFDHRWEANNKRII